MALKPCPFCGEPAGVGTQYENPPAYQKEFKFVNCTSCGAQMSPALFNPNDPPSEEEVVELWNTRVQLPEVTTRYDILKLLPPGPILGVEVGTDTGINARELLLSRHDLFLYTVDPWEVTPEFTEPGRGTAIHFYNERVGEFVKADRTKHLRLTSVDAAKHLSGRLPYENVNRCMSFDFVYIDASHREEQVKQDLEAWWPLLLKSGLFAGHDFEDPGVHTPVIRFAKAHRLDLRIINEHGGPEDMGSTPGSGYDRWGGWAHPSWYFFKG